MEDPTKNQAEQAQTEETPGVEGADEKTNFDELRESSEQFLRALFRTGAHVAMTPVSMMPEEPRQHFLSAGREFTRGLATLAHELSNVFDKMAEEAKGDGEKDS
ncbi:MAG TPA: hypothetical protein VJO32_15625 [Ktedonobacteraceae bacterium]|nr:hypothetical protein [Ktedonobacteraceae bacterium]